MTVSLLRSRLGWAAALMVAIAAAGSVCCGQTAQNPRDAEAREILDASGVRGGLVVHLGCGDGRLAAALGAGDRHLVQGLDTDDQHVAAARRNIREAGLYGRVSARRFDGRRLPYAEGVVNLLVADDLGDVSKDEVLRVLAPRGVAMVGDGGRWQKTVKPWPDEIDEWSHFLHDASNNAVASDSVVGPPRRLRWMAGPLWARSHEFRSSLSAMVSAGGRLFYIVDEGLTSLTDAPMPERWTLVARDAFNGVLLWRRPIDWGSGPWKSRALRSVPATVQRLLVADAERVFVTLGGGEPVSALDAATGEILATFDETEGTSEIRLIDGVLLLAAGNRQVAAVDAKTGKRLWQAEGKIQPLSLAAQEDKVFYQEGATLVCRRLADGEELWRSEAKRPASVVLVEGSRVLLLRGTGLEAVAADSGDTLWTVDAGVKRQELFAAGGRLWHWIGDSIMGGIVGRDLASGEISARLDTDDVFTPGHHLRCYQSKATEKFLITPNRGVEFVSIAGGENTQNDWTRGACRYGVMPSGGLLYVPPNPCFCYPGVKLTGFNALAPAGGEQRETPGAERLVRGPAYLPLPLGEGRGEGGRNETVETKTTRPHPAAAPPPSPDQPSVGARRGDDWPTYRHDGRRSGATECRVPAMPSRQWQMQLGGDLTPPVVAHGRAFVADKDTHTVFALDVDDGRTLWQFTAGGRIDSPPSICSFVVPPSGGIASQEVRGTGFSRIVPPEGGTTNNLCIFGSADGCVYCLRADDGALAWRFQAAPRDEQIVSLGQLESPWRVHGSVLLDGGLVYCTAGRSSYMDGGIWIFGLDPATGEIVHQARLDTWTRTRKDAQGKPFVPAYHMEGSLSDILVSQGGYIYLGQQKFDARLAEQEVPYIVPPPGEKAEAMDLAGRPFVAPDREPDKDYETHQRDWIERTQPELLTALRRDHGGASLGDRRIGLHVFATSGFLDDSWFNRTYWMYSATWPGFYLAHRASKTGQLLVVGPKRTYAVQAFPSRNLQSPLFTPGEKGYLLFADDNDNEPVLDTRTRGTTKGWGFTRAEPPAWHAWVPVRVRAMVLAGDQLFVAGPPDVVDPDDPTAAFEGRKGAVLAARSAADGSPIFETRLDAPPVFDGLIAAAGRLLISTTDGRVECFGQ